MPDYVVLISTLGDLEIFGLKGFVIGPAIAVKFLAVWAIFSASWERETGMAPTKSETRDLDGLVIFFILRMAQATDILYDHGRVFSDLPLVN